MKVQAPAKTLKAQAETEVFDISEINQELRSRINEEPTWERLFRDKQRYLQVCACLDYIADTDMALHSYLTDRLPKTLGFAYLVIHGVLQVLFTQQDAVEHLARALGASINLQQLQHIRDLRNDAIGHPTRRKPRGEKIPWYCGLVQVDMSVESFTLIISRPNPLGSERKEIEVKPLILEQQRVLHGAMTGIIAHVEREAKIG
jgi:hypothetical protein